VVLPEWSAFTGLEDAPCRIGWRRAFLSILYLRMVVFVSVLAEDRRSSLNEGRIAWPLFVRFLPQRINGKEKELT